MIVIGVICLLLGLILGVHILWYIGLVLLVIGGVLAILGGTRYAVGGRRWYY